MSPALIPSIVSAAMKKKGVPRSESSTDRTKDSLRGAGLRATPGRVAVLEHLAQANRPIAHAEIVNALAPRGLDRASIYRNLIDLAEAGLAIRSDLGDHVWRFELRAPAGTKEAHAGLGTHPHFVCVDCGEVVCLTDAEVAVHAGRRAPKAVRKNEVEVQLRGRCDGCAHS